MLYILLFAVIALCWIVLASLRAGISPMPSSQKAQEAIASLIPTDFDGEIADLGSGWGDLALFLAKRFPRSHVTGYEISYLPYCLSTLRASENLALIHRDFFTEPLHPYQIIVCYLYPEAMNRLKPKLEKELAAGALVISNTFAVPGWAPVKIIELDDLYHTKIYLYSFKPDITESASTFTEGINYAARS